MVFPISGVETPIWVPPLVAMVISFFTSMAGLSGAVLILPFQFSILGFTAPSVSSTNLVFNVVGIPSGVYRYFKEGRLNWHLASTITLGTLPGVFVGAIVRVVYLPDPAHFRIFAGCFLLYLGLRMFHQLYHDRANGRSETIEEVLRCQALSKAANSHSVKDQALRAVSFSLSRTEYEYCGKRFSFHTGALFGLSLAVGLLGGIYGVGGAAIISPLIVTLFRLPIHTVAGATLVSACITSIAGVLFYEFACPVVSSGAGNLVVSPDWLLGILFGVGGVVGMYLGASTQKYIPAITIRCFLAVLIFAIGVDYAAESFF